MKTAHRSITTISLGMTSILGVLTVSTHSAQAFQFGNNGIIFDKDTNVQFTFLGADGDFFNQGNLSFGFAEKNEPSNSTLVFNGKPSSGSAVSTLFKAGKEYTLSLNVPQVSSTLYTTSSLNPGSKDMAHFGRRDVFSGAGTNIAWEDTPHGDNDFNDYVVNVKATAVPTPALLPGLIGMGIAAFRKRKGEAVEQSSEA